MREIGIGPAVCIALLLARPFLASCSSSDSSARNSDSSWRSEDSSASDSSTAANIGGSSETIRPDDWETKIVDGYRDHCGGKGTRYCKRPWEAPCPEACVAQCYGGYISSDSQSDSEFSSMRLAVKRAIRQRAFDQAFIYSGKICLSNCHGGLGDYGCATTTRYGGATYCQALNCTKGIDGCHTRSDFATISCRACRIVFPGCK